jgi:hypothetical protein
MFYWRGNTNNEAISSPKNLPIEIQSYALFNKTGGGIGVNVYAIHGTSIYNISPNSVQLTANSEYVSDRSIILAAGQQVKIVTSGDVGFDFTFDNFQPILPQ